MSGTGLLAKILSLFGPSRIVHTEPLPTGRHEVIDDPDRLEPMLLTVVSPEQFDRAYEEYGRAIIDPPLEGRWIPVIPDVDRSQYPALKAQCDDVRWTAARWAEDIRCSRIAGNPDEVLERMIAAKYPFLTKRGRVQTHNYAWFATR